MAKKLQRLFTAALLTILLVPSAFAQMTVTVGDISGTNGETVFVPITLASVPTDGFSSFQFDVTVNNNNLTFNGHLTTGTLSSQSGWSVQSNDGNASSNPGRVGGFASNSDVIVSDGVLILLSFTINGTDGGAQVDLLNMRFARGATVNHTPEVPSTQLIISNPPVAVDDAYDVDEGETLTVDAAAGVLSNDSDADGDPLTATVGTDVSSGSLTLNADGSFEYVHDGSEGASDSFTYTVSDGSNTDVGTVTITVRQIDRYEVVLSGLNMPTANGTAATGVVNVDHNVTDDVLTVSGSFSGLGSGFAAAQLGVGALNEEGTAALSLLAGFTDPTFRSGSFDSSSNLLDLNVVGFPAGLDAATFKTALASGEVFVLIRSLDNSDGELRGQLRTSANTAPSAVDVLAPSSVTTTGNPTDPLVSVTWSGAPTDAESDETKLILEVSDNVSFTSILEVLDVSAAAGSEVTFSTDWAASLYDTITGREPGNILVGGTSAAYLRLTSTDGNLLASGSVHTLNITRASVTDTEDGALPSDFVLRGNYPNPFNPTTTISFDLPETADVQVDVLDLLGRTMISVPVQSISGGANRSISIDAADLTSGIYMYRVLARGASSTWVKSGTMTLIK
ncbi:MAG: Ig-like domain-containing protein [Rhodothermales bacterium]